MGTPTYSWLKTPKGADRVAYKHLRRMAAHFDVAQELAVKPPIGGDKTPWIRLRNRDESALLSAMLRAGL